MRTNKTLAILAAGLLAGSALLCGCTPHKDYEQSNYVTHVGVPISVEQSLGHYNAHLSAVYNVKDKITVGNVWSTQKVHEVVKAAALIQSEISDQDNDPITLTGILKDDGLQIKSVQVHNYLIRF